MTVIKITAMPDVRLKFATYLSFDKQLNLSPAKGAILRNRCWSFYRLFCNVQEPEVMAGAVPYSTQPAARMDGLLTGSSATP
jgi:hypothetical protein